MTIQTRAIRTLADLEKELERPPLNRWEALLEADPTATPFQSPVWCMPWYRSYDNFEPCLLMMTCNGELVGVVPLAIETSTGRLTFCGDNMSDYRDVLTRSEFRREVLGAFLQFYKHGNFPHVLHFGATTPESESPSLLLSMAREFRVRSLPRQNYGWRWYPVEQKQDPMKSRSLRYKINCLKRDGELEAQHIQNEQDWMRFRDAFYRQHTLRQIFGHRPVSFDNPRKRMFFDRIFKTSYAHVTALWLKGELIAGHFGSVYRSILYWGAPSFDVRHHQYSPSLVLLVLTMQRTAEWGFSAIDLTIGKGDLKERLSTTRVELPWIELYTSSSRFYARIGRLMALRVVRRLANWVLGEGAWDKKVKPFAQRALLKAQRMHEMGARQTLARMLELAAGKVGERTKGIVFVAHPIDVKEVIPQLRPDEVCAFHNDELHDLVKRDIWNDPAAREIAVQIRGFTDAVSSGRTLHTVSVNDHLAAWGYSYWPKEASCLTEVGNATIDFKPNSISLYGFYTLPEFRGRKLYQGLLTYILTKRFTEGAEQAYISVLAANVASKVAIERVGFRAVTINEFRRFLRWKTLRSRQPRDGEPLFT